MCRESFEWFRKVKQPELKQQIGTEPTNFFFFTCQQGADQADETASAQDTHTCDNFSQSRAAAAQLRGHQPRGACHSGRFFDLNTTEKLLFFCLGMKICPEENYPARKRFGEMKLDKIPLGK